MTEVLKMRFLVRSRTRAEWAALNEILLNSVDGTGAREMGVEEDTGRYKLGDGVTPWNSLPYKGDASPGLAFVAETSTATAADPGAGALKWSHATQASSAHLYLSGAAADGVDIEAFLAEQGATGFLQLVSANNNAKWQLWKWTAVTDNTGWWTFDVEYLAGTGAFADGEALRAGFVSAGGANYVAGNHISIDATDPANPVINVTGISTAGYAEGTVNPSSPGLNDKFYRTDLNLLIYFDGMRWLTVNEYELSMVSDGDPMPFLISHTTLRFPMRLDFPLYATRLNIVTFVTAAPLNATNYWGVALQYVNAANAATTIVSFDTKTDAAATWVSHGTAINAVINAAAMSLRISATKTGSPGNFLAVASLSYRLVVP